MVMPEEERTSSFQTDRFRRKAGRRQQKNTTEKFVQAFQGPTQRTRDDDHSRRRQGMRRPYKRLPHPRIG